MHIEQLLPLDDMATAVDAGRRSLRRIDLSGIPSAARDTIPGPWSRPKARRRWPFVGLLLVLATVVIGMTFLAPALRRRVTRAPDLDPTTDGDRASDTAMTGAATADVDPDSAGALPLDGFAVLADRPR